MIGNLIPQAVGVCASACRGGLTCQFPAPVMTVVMLVPASGTGDFLPPHLSVSFGQTLGPHPRLSPNQQPVPVAAAVASG